MTKSTISSPQQLDGLSASLLVAQGKVAQYITKPQVAIKVASRWLPVTSCRSLSQSRYVYLHPD